MTWDHRKSAINGSQFINGSGARPAFMIGWEAELMKSQTIGWKGWPILWSLMKTSCA
jgi:hypothetical protein